MRNSVEHAAREWIKEIEKKKKLNKEARRAVISFAFWLDEMINREEMKEELENEKKD